MITKIVKRLSQESILMFLGLASLFWGLWYINPVIRDVIDGRYYFEPPIIVGMLAVLLGIASLLCKHKLVVSSIQIMFWSYLTIFLLLTQPQTTLIPISALLTLVAVTNYTMQWLRSND